MKEKKPSEFYRQQVQTVLVGYFQPPVHADNEIVDQLFLSFLEEYFPKWRSELLELISQNAPRDEITGFCHGFFALSLGYLTYGYIEAAEEVIKCIPFLAVNSRRFAEGGLAAILSFPENINPTARPEGALAWLKENAHRLQWDEEKGKFVLQT